MSVCRELAHADIFVLLTFLQTQSYRDGWTKVTHPGWSDFYKTWWGDPGAVFENALNKPLSERFLYVDQKAVKSVFKTGHRGNTLLVRDEYLGFNERIRNARRELGEEMRGCLLLGQQGIGARGCNL